MTAGAIAKKALTWLAGRTKKVAKHVGLHNSKPDVAGKTRPWILNKAAHSVTLGGDRVTRKICERTLKSFDHYVAQSNGRHAFTKLFGRRVGRLPEQTAFRVIVDANGRIVTAFAVTAAQAASSTSMVFALEDTLVRTIGGLNGIEAAYAAVPPREESLAEGIVDFFMSELGNTALNANEDMMLAKNRFREIMENVYIAHVEKALGKSIAGDERRLLRDQFRDGIAGAVAPYVEDDG